jgi:hypothetical protein
MFTNSLQRRGDSDVEESKAAARDFTGHVVSCLHLVPATIAAQGRLLTAVIHKAARPWSRVRTDSSERPSTCLHALDDSRRRLTFWHPNFFNFFSTPCM